VKRLVVSLTVAAMTASLACRPEPADPRRLRFSASAKSAEDVLRIQGTVTTMQFLPSRIEYGACSMELRLYSTAERAEPAAWRGFGGGDRGCRAYLAVDHLSVYGSSSAPEFAAWVSARELPASVPDGTYYASVTMGLVTPQMRSAEMPAGVLVVRGSRRGPRPLLAGAHLGRMREPMAGSTFVYVTYIRTTPKKLWSALTDDVESGC
jgi:hypothetical protein